MTSPTNNNNLKKKQNASKLIFNFVIKFVLLTGFLDQIVLYEDEWAIFLLKAEASLQARRLSLSAQSTKPCDKPCFNGGICRDGICRCPTGWIGSQCDSCFGRVK